MKNINLQNQYNGESIKMDGSFIMGLNKKWGISRMDFALELMEKYNLFWKEKFLDVGCGDGEVCKLVEGQFTEVYGIEIVEERIKRFYKHTLIAGYNSLFEISIKNWIFKIVLSTALQA